MKLLSILDHSSRPGHRASGLELDLPGLAALIDREGVRAVAPEALADLARRGRLLGLHPQVADVLIDDAAPPVVRARVFDLIRRRLGVGPSVTDPVAA